MKMNKIVPENCHASMKELDSEVKILCGMTQHIVIDILGMWHVAMRLIPKDLTVVQKCYYKIVVKNLISKAKYDLTYMKWIITSKSMPKELKN